MADEPGFRDALILESYITLKGLETAAQAIAAQFSGGAAGKMLAMMGLGNGGEKAS
jgi:hypothetical protein